MSGIRLSKTLGVNPRLFTIHCALCGKKDEQIVLLGASNHVDVCRSCGMQHIGGVDRKRNGDPACCQQCGNQSFDRRKLDDYERFDTSGICPECQEHMKQGIIISVLGGEDGQKERPITGYFVVKEEAVRGLFGPDGPFASIANKLQNILDRRAMHMEDGVARSLGLFDMSAGGESPPNGGELPPKT